ncbi:trypsin-like peptidase domain-containing protein [Kitasatospora sp. HPMI-4]|uniref:trypsin-like peptidase domain-containing protein n=1 Tax=Kitasatospora sp. HPMI-4 TaxID=3448443 RepID=UPI003F195690
MAADRWSGTADGWSRGPVDPRQALLRICGPDGRMRGLGFVVDPHGTVVTAHETVAGLDRVVLHTEGGQARVLGADCVEPLARHGLALVRTEAVGGLPVPPLPIGGPGGSGDPVEVPYFKDGGTAASAQGRVLGTGTAMYPWQDEFHLISGALWLEATAAVPAGAPVVDAGTGAVLGVVAPSLPPGHAGAVAAVPLVPAVGPAGRAAAAAGLSASGPPASGPAPAGALAGVVARNAATVPAYGRALNAAGVVQLASVQLGSAVAGPGRIADLAADRVDRPDGLTGEEPRGPFTVLVGAPGSGRTTELAALAVRRAGGCRPLPTLWLRGAELRSADESLADAVGRILARAAGLLGVDAPDPGRAARLCAEAGRPLLVLLDAPEEAHAAVGGPWLRATSQWLRAESAGLLTACRPERWAEWEGADDTGGTGAAGAVVHGLGPLPKEAAERAARRYGLAGRPPVPPEAVDGVRPVGNERPLAPSEAAHPLALRIAGELRSAGVRWHGAAPRRGELFEGYLDLVCLRIAGRLAGGAEVRRPGAHRRGGPRPGEPEPGRVRRLAAAVAGRVHEAARQMLGSGHGGLPADAFELLFPTAGGWASAVLGERLFVAAGDGYRLAYEELAEWLQGQHLDLDGALRLLLGEDGADGPDSPEGATEGAAAPWGPAAGARVPRHRAGPVVAALARIGEIWGAEALDGRLHRLWRALELSPAGSEAAWWAGHLLAAALRSATDLAVHRPLLRRLAELREHSGAFGPAFWAALPLAPEDRLDLLRRLVRSDGAAQAFRTAAAEALAADPRTVIPLLCRWFEDGHRLAARPGGTVAGLAHDLLYAHRKLALDDLTECLVETAHPRADALLTLLAADEPSALCRAVDRWSHDPRPERHVAAAVHALRTVPHATGSALELLSFTATTLLAREGEPALHGAALALLVQDGRTRGRYLAAAIARYLADDQFVTAQVLAPALAERPEPVLAAFRQRLAAPGAALAEGLRVLAQVPDPAVARQGLDLAAEVLREHPEWAGRIADYLDRLLAGPPGTRAGESPAAPAPGAVRAAVARRPCAEPREMLRALALAARPAPVRRVIAVRLAAPGLPARGPLLAALLAEESDEGVLTAVLECLAERCAEHSAEWVRELVRRIAARTARADAALVRCAGRSASFARLLAEWPPAENPPAGGPLLARMRGLAAAGRDPQYAAAEAERGAPRPSSRAGGLPVPKPTRAHGTL